MLLRGDSSYPHLWSVSSGCADFPRFQLLARCVTIQAGLKALTGFFLQGTKFPRSQHTVPKHEQAHTQLCPYQTASFELCPSSALSPWGSRAAVTVRVGRTWHLTHHFRFEGWLNLSVLQFLPVNSPEESVFPDVSFTLQATAKAFCRMFSHQLLGRKYQTIHFNAGRKVRVTFPCLQCSYFSPEDTHC